MAGAVAGVVLLGVGAGVPALVAQGDPPPSLPYSRGFLITGDYAVGGVDLREGTHPIQNGFSTAPIAMSGVPQNADILAAYLYWETVTTGGDAWKTEAAGVKFRGYDLDITNVLSVKRTAQLSSGAACYGSGSLTMQMFRGDVLRFLPINVDSDGKPTGKRLVNSADLTAQGLDPHTVTLPVRDGNAVPETAGASLVVVYRDSNPNAALKKVVIYDGNVIKPTVNTALGLTIKGIYGSSLNKSAKITHIISSGQPNSRLQFSFAGAGDTVDTTIAGTPFSDGPASQRWWANPTIDVSSLMDPGSYAGAYGETVQTKIFHSPANGSYDCVASGAVVFSTAVADVDADGLPDALEDRTTALTDADDIVLPNLDAMGAGSDQKDIFIEVNAMTAAAGTTYGSLAAPFAPGAGNEIKTDPLGHNHLPTPYALRLVGKAFADHNIRVHFDVGNVSAYHSLGVITRPDFVDDYSSTEADTYLIPSALARGGEIIAEVACDPSKPACHFPDYPGTVPWKLGMQAHRDAPVDDAGNELVPVTQSDAAVSFELRSGGPGVWNGRRRFDPERRGLFRYLLYAHARGNPKSLPCIVDGQPAPYLDDLLSDTPNCAGMDNPAFDPLGYHAPTSASGVAELPGGNFMVTLGLWDEFVGRPFVRASTTFHELGHTLGLFHGGPETERTNESGAWQPGAVRWGNASTANLIEPNCKPNYLSSMSYLFQVHGLFDDTDEINLDYSWTKRIGIDERLNLSDGAFPAEPAGVPSYQAAWFAPASSPLALSLAVPAAKRFCNGVRFDPLPAPLPALSRVFADSSASVIDWNGNGFMDEVPANADVNFDNTFDALTGLSDWDNIRLNQTGAVVTGVTAGSAEGVFFDNSGTANGVFFDNSGVFFDQSGVWFDNSGVWFDNAGGVFFDNSGVFFDNSGVFFDNSGVWFDNAGGVFFDNAGGVFFDNAGGVFFDNAGGVFFDVSGGVFFDNSGSELTFDDAKSFGRGRPHKAATCVIDETVGKLVTQQPDPRVCVTALPNQAGYHRIEVKFEQLQVGGIDEYLLERKLASADDSGFAEAGRVGAHLVSFTEPAELPDAIDFTYRVRGLASDEFGNSGWSRYVTETAVNTPPVAVDDAYAVAAGSTLTVNALIGVLANDTVDVDSPATSRSVFRVVTGPVYGTLTLSPNGSFTYAAFAGYAGPDSFTYEADNGPWSGDPGIRLSPPSSVATVSITVSNQAPTCTLLTATVAAGSSTVLTPSCTDPNGDTLTISGATVVTGGGSITASTSSSFTYAAPSTGGTATLTYNVSDGVNPAVVGSATITVNAPPRYGFVNVQNLPPPSNKAKTGSTIPLKWRWTTNGVAVNTAGQAIVKAYSCSGALVGAFTPAQPGNDNTFSFEASTKTWTFNLKLVNPTTGANLPVGNYVVQVQNSVTLQIDPNTPNASCGGIVGALIQVVK